MGIGDRGRAARIGVRDRDLEDERVLDPVDHDRLAQHIEGFLGALVGGVHRGVGSEKPRQQARMGHEDGVVLEMQAIDDAAQHRGRDHHERLAIDVGEVDRGGGVGAHDVASDDLKRLRVDQKLDGRAVDGRLQGRIAAGQHGREARRHQDQARATPGQIEQPAHRIGGIQRLPGLGSRVGSLSHACTPSDANDPAGTRRQRTSMPQRSRIGVKGRIMPFGRRHADGPAEDRCRPRSVPIAHSAL